MLVGRDYSPRVHQAGFHSEAHLQLAPSRSPRSPRILSDRKRYPPLLAHLATDPPPRLTFPFPYAYSAIAPPLAPPLGSLAPLNPSPLNPCLPQAHLAPLRVLDIAK